jgi:ABC-type multidrug transport system ATPase subunit
MGEDPVTELPLDLELAGYPTKCLLSSTSLPVPSVRLEFNHITCTIPPSPHCHHPRLALDNVSGHANPGQILAIMGASGSGKTTLLNILCERHALNKISHIDSHQDDGKLSSFYSKFPKSEKKSESGLSATGSLLLNNTPSSRELFRSYGVYVTQEDHLLRTFSPRESIAFTASLKLPRSFTPAQQQQQVEHVIKMLRLQDCADTPVGDFRHPGISGGERKRTAIAVELLSNPSICILDEPTSGLDSYTALKVIEVLRDLAYSGRTIIMTVHQPSPEMYELFDSLLILSDGKSVYFGPTDDARNYFESFGMHIPATTNPADFFLRMVENQLDNDDDYVDLLDSSKEEMQLLLEKINDASNKELFRKFSQDSKMHSLLPCTVETKTFEVRPMSEQIKCLAKRAITNYWRQIETTAMQITQVLFCSLLVGLLFFDLGTSQSSVTSRKGALFEIMMNLFMLSFASIACSFPSERPLFLKEKANNMYSTSTYFWSKVTLEFAFQSIWPLMYLSIVYFMVGFQSSLSNFLWFVIVALLVTNIAYSVGLFMGSCLTVPEHTMQILPMVVIPLTLFVALFLSQNSIPVYYVWMQWISPFHYAYELFCIIEFVGLSFECSSSDGSICTYTTGESVLTALEIDVDDFYLNLVCLVAIYLTFITGSFAALSWRKERV